MLSWLYNPTTERREIVYRWHPLYGHTVSIVGAMLGGGVAIFRCRPDDSSRCLEIPQWMFDAAMRCRAQLASRAFVACHALSQLRDLIDVTERISSAPVLEAEHLLPHDAGGAHAMQKKSKNVERATTAVPSDATSALDQPTSRVTRNVSSRCSRGC